MPYGSRSKARSLPFQGTFPCPRKRNRHLQVNAQNRPAGSPRTPQKGGRPAIERRSPPRRNRLRRSRLPSWSKRPRKSWVTWPSARRLVPSKGPLKPLQLKWTSPPGGSRSNLACLIGSACPRFRGDEAPAEPWGSQRVLDAAHRGVSPSLERRTRLAPLGIRHLRHLDRRQRRIGLGRHLP